MKTFTTYAEKKAKQFFNLLQGYTKGIRFTAILILLLMGVSNALGKDIYFKPSENWKEANAWFQVWDGQHNHNFESTGIAGLYKATIEDDKTSIWIKRKQPNTDNDWDGGSETQISTYNYFYNSNWSNSMSRSNIIGTVRGGKIYFDNSKTKWTGNIQFVIGHDSYSRTYSMSQLKNTDLWYVNLDAATYREWGDAKYYAVISTTNKVTDGAWGSTSLSTKAPSYRTTIYNGPFSLDYGSSYLVTPSSESPTASSITISYVSTYSSLNSQQTIKSAVNDTDANSKAPISITSYAMTGNGTATEQTATLGTGAKDSYITAARTATTTLTVGDVETGYQFDGWYTAATGGTQLSKEKTYTYYPTAATTVYARFSAKKYTVLFGVHSSGHGSLTAKIGNTSISSNSKVNYGSTIVFTASPSTGYEIEGWYSDADCTTSLNNGTNKTYTIESLTAAATVYVKFKQKQHTILFGKQGNGTITAKVGNTSITSGNKVNYGSEVVFTATPSTGYQIEGWYKNSDCTTSLGNGTNNTYTVTITGGTNVYVKFVAQQYTITYKDQNNATFSGTHADSHPTTHTYGTTTTLKDASKAGYTFDGWFTTSACTGTAVTSLGATDYTSHITLYAKWTESQAKHDVRVLYMCGDVVVKEAETIAVGEILPTSITAPAVTGYTFSEWKLGDGLVTENNLTAYTINLKTKSSGDYTLTANYIKYQYTLKFGVLGYGGSVSAIADGNEIASPASLDQDSKVILTATAKDGYVFHKWINSTGDKVSEANPYEHTMIGSTTINAVFKNTRMLYLKPNDGWKGGDARFAAYFYRDGSGDTYWANMTSEFACDKSNGIYKVPIPDGTWEHVIFVRMNPSFNENRWNNNGDSDDNKPVWNQTGNLTIPTNGDNLFELPTTGNRYWDGAETTWKKHTSTYEPVYLTYNVEVPPGTPNCYISGKMNGWSFTEMEKVDDTHYTITIQDACENHGYKYCYGPSWDCQEVKKSDFTAIDNRKHSTDDKVEAWIKYCLVGNNNIGWSWNDAYSFDIAGDMSHNFNANYYDIKVMSSIGEYYTHNEYTYDLHRSHTSVKIPHKGGEKNQLILQADLTGTYKFHFDPVSKLLTIEFPEKGYRLKITMADGSGKVYTSNAVEDATETLSFFAPGTDDTELSGTIILEHKGSKEADIPATLFKTSGVYTAKLNSDKNGITDIKPYDGSYYIRTDGANGGWSNYKTDSDNKMTYFVPREEEKYSYYWVQALPRAPRDHTNGVVNVKACVANDYNDNLAIMLEADKFTSDNYGNVNILDPDEHHREKINVRFGYNPKTNHFERAMLTGSGNINTFLNIFDPLPEGYLYKTNNNGTLETQLTAASQDNKFTDISNWVYERDVWVNVQNDKDVTVCLTAVSYNGARNSLFGFDDEAQTVPTQRTIVAKNSTQEPKKMRVIYDFKTNRMIMAWMPGEYECNGEEALIADVLFMRHENDPVPQLTMKDTDGENGVTPQIKGIQTQFFALELENKGNQNYEEHYWITLPFNCIVGSISGVPGYMQTWGIQRYNGKKRAEKGWWKETETFWEWLGPDDVMEAGVGYVLSFDKKAATWNTFDVHTEHDDGSVTTTQKSLLRLYFPSTEKDFTFKANNNFVKTYADEPCEIKTANRHLQDGNWKIIGPLSYNSATATASPTTGDQVWQPEENGDHITVPDGDYNWAAPMFLYEYTYDNSTQYNRENNWKYVVKNTIGYTYKAFFGYMVQFAGTMTWYEISQSIHPRLRARTYTDQVPTNITTNLELLDAEGVQHDQTFVALDVEGTTTYDLNKDLNKVFNNNFANIYTLSENIPFAGNTLPMEKAIVPVGVRIATAGEYTFRMPDGTDGISVTLIDNQTGTQTDMLMSEYTVTLDAGTIENRFYLVVDPDRTATSVENIGEEAKGEEAKGQIKKFLIDGKLFIRTADGIFDAKGQRL